MFNPVSRLIQKKRLRAKAEEASQELDKQVRILDTMVYATMILENSNAKSARNKAILEAEAQVDRVLEAETNWHVARMEYESL